MALKSTHLLILASGEYSGWGGAKGAPAPSPEFEGQLPHPPQNFKKRKKKPGKKKMEEKRREEGKYKQKCCSPFQYISLI